MKKSLLTCLAACFMELITFCGCHFSAGTQKDVKTGLSVSYNGFAIEGANLTDASGKQLNSNKIPMDSTFAIQVKGVQNYTLRNGKAFPGCELTITDKNNKLLASAPDLMENVVKDGLEPKGAAVLYATISLHPPFKRGETYHIAARFFDKENVKNEIKTDVDVTLQ